MCSSSRFFTSQSCDTLPSTGREARSIDPPVFLVSCLKTRFCLRRWPAQLLTGRESLCPLTLGVHRIGGFSWLHSESRLKEGQPGGLCSNPFWTLRLCAGTKARFQVPSGPPAFAVSQSLRARRPGPVSQHMITCSIEHATVCRSRMVMRAHPCREQS